MPFVAVHCVGSDSFAWDTVKNGMESQLALGKEKAQEELLRGVREEIAARSALALHAAEPDLIPGTT